MRETVYASTQETGQPACDSVPGEQVRGLSAVFTGHLLGGQWSRSPMEPRGRRGRSDPALGVSVAHQQSHGNMRRKSMRVTAKPGNVTVNKRTKPPRVTGVTGGALLLQMVPLVPSDGTRR